MGVVYLPNALLFYASTFIYIMKPNDAMDTWKLDHRYTSIADCIYNSVYDELVVIERPILQLLAELPDAYRKPKFGS
jgi:hypothetical protein